METSRVMLPPPMPGRTRKRTVLYRGQDAVSPRAESPKSPLRYAGGKTRGAAEICGFIPDDARYLCSPFIGGGSVEILCAARGMRVSGFDNYAPLVEFWQCLLGSPKRLAGIVREYFPLKREQFYELQHSHGQIRSKYRRAAIYYVINRCSFSGVTMSGGMSPGHPRFTESAIRRLEEFRISNMTVELADFKASISECDDESAILYLDPPYMTAQGLYGMRGDMHRRFDHKALAAILQRRDGWILSYNNTKAVRDLYAGCYFHYPQWKYGMSNDKDSREILIISQDLAQKCGLGV